MKEWSADLQKTNDALLAEIGERRSAQEELRASEQPLQDILDNSTAVVSVKDLELRYILVNREYEDRFHVKRDQIRGKTDYDIHPRDIAEIVQANDRQVIDADSSVQFEVAVPTREGERHYVINKFLLRDRTAKPYAVCGIATDITERKRAEEQLAQLNRTLQTLYQCNQALVRATEECELLQSVCRILVEVGGLRMAWVGLPGTGRRENGPIGRLRRIRRWISGTTQHYVGRYRKGTRAHGHNYQDRHRVRDPGD